MKRNTTPTVTTGTGGPEGVVAGAVLQVIRKRRGLFQDQAAQALGCDVDTYRSWENGRRPLSRVSVHKLRGLHRGLSRLGADPAHLDLLDTAIDVDLDLGRILNEQHSPADHPLGTLVQNRTWHDLLQWAVAGKTPPSLRNGADVPRPRLSVPDREHLLTKLRTSAEQADSTAADTTTLLRRQVYFVASWDDSGAGQDWLAKMGRRELRRLRAVDGWTPSWVTGRSLAVAKAVSGDPEQLRHFIANQLVADDQEIANLRYWAHWAGEDTQPAISDDFMRRPDLGPWRGTELLRHLTAGMTGTTPYLDLTIHTVHALIERRPWLLDDDPALTTDLQARSQTLLDPSQPLSDQARRELDQINFATKMRRHQ